MNAQDPSHDDRPELANANARLGLQLFAVYLVLYLGFVLGSAFAPGFMASSTPFWGLNVAILYGIGLIKAAFFLAVVYVVLCGRASRRVAAENAGLETPEGGPR